MGDTRYAVRAQTAKYDYDTYAAAVFEDRIYISDFSGDRHRRRRRYHNRPRSRIPGHAATDIRIKKQCTYPHHRYCFYFFLF